MLLVIDDDKAIREDIILSWWKQKYDIDKSQVIWLVEYPSEGLVEYLSKHSNIEYISFDHDLGEKEVSSELNKEMWEYEDFEFQKAFDDKIIKIHSMNPRGAENIYHKLVTFAGSVEICSLMRMVSELND